MTKLTEMRLRASRPVYPAHWEGPQVLREIARRSGQDEVLRYLHWPRRLTVVSGVGLTEDGVVMHVSVSHWGLYESERASDHDCHFALDHFGAPAAVTELHSNDLPEKKARDFVWVASEKNQQKSA